MSILQLKGCYNTDELLKIHRDCVDSCCGKKENETVNGGESTVNDLEEPKAVDNGEVVPVGIVPEKYIKNRLGRGRKLNPEYVYFFMAKHGYTALSKYVNNSTLLEFRCPNNHVHSMTFGHFQQGQRCKICQNKKNGETQKHSHKYVDKYMGKFGYTRLSEYINTNEPIKFRCPNNHVNSMIFKNFQRGHRCNICKYEKQAESRKNSHEYVDKYMGKFGYTRLSKYINSKRPIKFLCPNGHIYSMRFDSFQKGQRCGKCHEKTLKGCTTITAYTILQRTIQRGSTIPEDELRQLIELEILIKIQSFYNAAPPGHHVDHIVPFSFFDHNNADQIKACWSIFNLRYLSASENFSRGNRFNIDDIEKMPFNAVNHLIAIAVNAKNTPKEYKNAIQHLMLFDSVESDYNEYWEEIVNG